MKDLFRIFICRFVGMAINLVIYWDLISHGPLSTLFNNSFCLWYQRNFLTQNVRHSHSYNQWTDLKLQCWCVGLRAPFRALRWSWKHIRRHRRRQRWTTAGSTGSKAWCVCNKFTQYFEEFIQRDQSFKIFLQQEVWNVCPFLKSLLAKIGSVKLIILPWKGDNDFTWPPQKVGLGWRGQR